MSSSLRAVIGSSVVKEPRDFTAALKAALRAYPDGVLVEEYVEGMDVAVGFVEGVGHDSGPRNDALQHGVPVVGTGQLQRSTQQQQAQPLRPLARHKPVGSRTERRRRLVGQVERHGVVDRRPSNLYTTHGVAAPRIRDLLMSCTRGAVRTPTAGDRAAMTTIKPRSTDRRLLRWFAYPRERSLELGRCWFSTPRHRTSQETLPVTRASHALDRIEATFDGSNLVANAGLLLVATLTERLGVRR